MILWHFTRLEGRVHSTTPASNETGATQYVTIQHHEGVILLRVLFWEVEGIQPTTWWHQSQDFIS